MRRCAALGLLSLLAVHQLEGQAFRLMHVPGLDEYVAIPDDNPLTPAKIALGARLFFDRVLSRDSSLSCASCHRPERAFSDSAARSRGVRGQLGRRNAPSIINRAYGASFFWDGRAASLEEQVLQPISDSLELDLPLGRLVDRLATIAGYREAFDGEFPDGVTKSNIARALAAYVRTIRSGDAPIDRYRAGDTTALSPEALRGLTLFQGKANCVACHSGSNFTDERFHNTGVAHGGSDAGRFTVTKDRADRAAFKTPTLRDVARTAPYMHDGSLATLEDVVEFYDRGGRPNPFLDREIRPLGLSADERRDLVAFLNALTGTVHASHRSDRAASTGRLPAAQESAARPPPSVGLLKLHSIATSALPRRSRASDRD
jgi:cytochrome c peroxidase